MEQERVTLIILISTAVVLIFVIAMIVLFSVFQTIKYKLLKRNKTLFDIIKRKLPALHID